MQPFLFISSFPDLQVTCVHVGQSSWGTASSLITQSYIHTFLLILEVMWNRNRKGGKKKKKLKVNMPCKHELETSCFVYNKCLSARNVIHYSLELFKRWIALSTGWITIQWITHLVFILLIRWILIYLADGAIHFLNNRGQVFICF